MTSTQTQAKPDPLGRPDIERANNMAYKRLTQAEPVLTDIQRAGDVVPGMTPSMILTSGAPLEWPEYYGGQRNAIMYGALYEGLADTLEAADRKLGSGEIILGSTHDHGCVGSVAGIYTASMPVFVVDNTAHGNRAFCNFYEGESRRRLNYGVYDEEVSAGLRFLERELAPILRAAVTRRGGIPLKPRSSHGRYGWVTRCTAATRPPPPFSRES